MPSFWKKLMGKKAQKTSLQLRPFVQLYKLSKTLPICSPPQTEYIHAPGKNNINFFGLDYCKYFTFCVSYAL